MFKEILSDLLSNHNWQSIRYANDIDEIIFLNSAIEEKISFVFFEDEILKIEGSFTNEKFTFDNGKFLELVKVLPENEKEASIIERVSLSLNTMTMKEVKGFEELKSKMKVR